MKAADVRYLVIHFNDGSNKRLMFERADEAATALTRMQKTLDQGELVLEFQDKLMVVPLSSVKYLEVAPKPDVKIPNAVQVIDEME